MTLHASTMEFFITACYIIIFGFMIRSFCARFPDSPITKALAFIY